MQPHSYVALVTIAALLVYIWMGVRVGQARAKSGVAAPAMTGDPILERHIRVHYNTLEWLPIFLAGLWLFAIYWNDLFAAGLGLVWIVGRIVYALGYVSDPKKREAGFMIQLAATAILLFGAGGPALVEAFAGMPGGGYLWMAIVAGVLLGVGMLVAATSAPREAITTPPRVSIAGLYREGFEALRGSRITCVGSDPDVAGPTGPADASRRGVRLRGKASLTFSSPLR